MVLLQVCIACNKPISASTQPVYKDNNGDLIYHPNCYPKPLLILDFPLPRLDLSKPIQLIPMDLVVGYPAGLSAAICFIDAQKVLFPEYYALHDIPKSSPISELNQALDTWLKSCGGTTQCHGFIQIEKQNLIKYGIGSISDVYSIIDLVSSWCSNSGTNYYVV